MRWGGTIAVAILCAAAGEAAGQERGAGAAAASRTIVPGVRFGPIEESTSRARLGVLFGANRVRDADIGLGEGICTPGTEVLFGTEDAIDVAWQDARRTQVAFVRTRSTGERWVTLRGVHVGTTLRELERLSGRVLTFSGFGWDYGGGLSWTEGGGQLGLRLDIDRRDNEKLNTAANNRHLFGDQLVSSDDPLIRQLRIAVDEMTQAWGPHFEERDCG